VRRDKLKEKWWERERGKRGENCKEKRKGIEKKKV